MRFSLPAMAALGSLLCAGLAHAHVGLSTPTPYAKGSAEASFNVGHGCEGLDTYSVKITIPSGVTGVRVVENGSFATVTTEKDAADTITSVTFTKAQGAVRAADDAFYRLVLRFTLPDAPFSTLYFPTTQVCKNQDGSVTKTTEWIGKGGDHGAEGEEPAPTLLVLPARSPGWNKYTAPAGMAELPLATVFKDAQIVWAGDAAYSVNPLTVEQIKNEDGVSLLESIEPGTEFWVKY